MESLKNVTRQQSLTPHEDYERINQLSIAIEALQKRQKYYDTFLYKAQSSTVLDNDIQVNDNDDLEFADTSHFEIYNAQLVWSLANRDIVFKFVDELFVHQKKKFSQNRTGLMLMRKMSQSRKDKSDIPLMDNSNSQKQNGSSNLSPKETIDSFFESLLERKSCPNSPSVDHFGPFTATAEPELSEQGKKDKKR